MTIRTRLHSLLLLALGLLTACASAAEAPVLDPAAQIATIAAATVAALPSNTPYPTRTSSRTLLPSLQETASLGTPTPIPSLTLFPSDTPWATLPAPGATGGGGLPVFGGAPILYTATPQKWMCEMRRVTPEDGSFFPPRTTFRVDWRVYNMGSKIWKVGEVRVNYMGGTPMQNSPDFVNDMPIAISVYPQDKLVVHMSMTSPKEPGDYTSFWALVEGKKNVFCTFAISIHVR